MSTTVRSVAGLTRTVLAVALAYALALQAFAGGFHSARTQATASPALCAPGSDGSSQPTAPDADHAALCCILGCAGSPQAPGPDRAITAAPITVVAIRVSTRPVDRDVAATEPRPLGARAPPVLA